jgi:hypothetical protein
MTSTTGASIRNSDQRQSWALVPFGTRSPILKPVHFESEEEVELCWSVPIFVGWGENRDLLTRADWLKAIASDVPVPIVPTGAEQLETIRKLKPPRPRPNGEEITALFEQWLAAKTSDDARAKFGEYVLGRYSFFNYRLWATHPESTTASRIYRNRGSEAFFQFLKWRREHVNPVDRFVQIPAPVHSLSKDEGPICESGLSEYLRPNEINPVSGDLETMIDSWRRATPLLPFMPCLHPDWNFDEIQRRAGRLQWHQAPELKLRVLNARQYFACVVLELDDARRQIWPKLSAAALQAFWTSWEVAQHLTGIEERIRRYASEPGAVAAGAGEIAEARCTVESIVRHYVVDAIARSNSQVAAPAREKCAREMIFAEPKVQEASRIQGRGGVGDAQDEVGDGTTKSIRRARGRPVAAKTQEIFGAWVDMGSPALNLNICDSLAREAYPAEWKLKTVGSRLRKKLRDRVSSAVRRAMRRHATKPIS